MVRKILKKSKLTRLVLAFLPILVFGGLVYAGAASAATYYIAPSGSDSAAGTNSAPWGTFAHAMTVLQPGDTLYLEDGTYTSSNNPGQAAIFDITVSGTSGAPITFKALNEGKAIIDGQQSFLCAQVYTSYVEIDGINFRNSGGDNGYTWGNGMNLSGNYITVRRCIVNGFGYSDLAPNSGENNCAGMNFIGGSNDLVEDSAIYINANTNQANGGPRIGINVYCNNSIFRRNYIYRQPGGNALNPKGIQFYGANYDIAENNVIIDDMAAGGDGIFMWYNNYSSTLEHNKAYGNIVMNTGGWGIWAATKANSNPAPFEGDGSDVENNAVIGSAYGLRNGGDDKMTIENNTVAGLTGSGEPAIPTVSWDQSGYPSGYVLNTALENNSMVNDAGGGASAWGSYIGSITENYNDFYNSNPAGGGGSGDKTINPNYDTATYGNGAYLMVPSALKGQGANGTDIGANVIYEYVNGTLTSTPLWPWPMESRIQSELGKSVTWASNGGIWQTLNGIPASSSSGGASGSTTGSTSGSTTGTGATSSSAAPELVSPSSGQVTSTTVTFAWTKPGQGNPAGYKLWYSQNSDLSSGSLATVTNSQAQAQANSAFAGLGMGLLPFGIMFPAGIMFTNKKKRLLLVATLLVAAVAFSSCGGGGGASGTTASSGGNTASSNVSTTVSGLASGTTYYWAVQTVDSSGHVTSQSSTGSFKTQ